MKVTFVMLALSMIPGDHLLWAQKYSRFLSNSLSSCLLILRRGRHQHLVMRHPTTSGGLPPPGRCTIVGVRMGMEKGLREPRIGAPADKQPFGGLACSLNPLMSFHLPHLAWSLIDKSWLSNPRSEAEGGARIGGLGRGFRIPSKAPKRALNVCPSSRAQCLLHCRVQKVHGKASVNFFCLICQSNTKTNLSWND